MNLMNQVRISKTALLIQPIHMEVLVFKTNLHDSKQISAVTPHINNLQGIARWNVDLDDVDNVLRIESENLCARTVETTLQQAGYICEELQ